MRVGSGVQRARGGCGGGMGGKVCSGVQVGCGGEMRWGIEGCGVGF